MTTLIIIASLALNVYLIATVVVLNNRLITTKNIRENQLIELNKHIYKMMSIYEPYKRTIEGRMALGTQDIGLRYLDHLRKNPKEGLGSTLCEYVIKQVAKQIVIGIEMELNDNPQYMKITHKTESYEVLIDFSFPFILYPGREKLIEEFSRIVNTAPDHFTKPSIIRKHF
ncbi:hypothetical protein HCX49_21920 [Sphingobacterium kitahiroshimense]|uniref:hypothetical protein n=1 Tax=Sphingobacterium sp. B16(2022) TaxID=2914044 RepID=UPI001438F781|nr:hypothetical protein [Sphingobacterium sp. B16(2022)]NJI75859.1 hypothetical protein [Sphingobacterium sp. B16(2022)]